MRIFNENIRVKPLAGSNTAFAVLDSTGELKRGEKANVFVRRAVESAEAFVQYSDYPFGRIPIPATNVLIPANTLSAGSVIQTVADFSFNTASSSIADCWAGVTKLADIPFGGTQNAVTTFALSGVSGLFPADGNTREARLENEVHIGSSGNSYVITRLFVDGTVKTLWNAQRTIDTTVDQYAIVYVDFDSASSFIYRRGFFCEVCL